MVSLPEGRSLGGAGAHVAAPPKACAKDVKGGGVAEEQVALPTYGLSKGEPARKGVRNL